MMKAWVLHGINDLKLDEVPAPMPHGEEVLVEVKAAGICSSDVPRVYSTGAYNYPIILGHEFSGLTSGGYRVGVFPLLPCHNCESCRVHHYETCSDYKYLGSRQDGAFAEYVAVPKWNLVILPDSMTYEQASLLEPAAVALHAVHRLDMSDIKSVAVVGDGTIGRLIVKWLSILEVSTVAIFGRDDTMPHDHFDACLEAVGTTDALRRCIELVKPNGQLVLVGNPYAAFNIDQNLYWQILRKQIDVKGSWNSSYPEDWHEVLENADELHLDCYISHRYYFRNLAMAFELIHDKTERHGKVIVTLD